MIETNKLMDIYENKIIRSLIQLIPYGVGSAIDVVLQDTIHKYQSKRLKIFFDKLASSKIEFTEELKENEEFLHCYFATVKAVLTTRRKEKIEYIANLFEAVTSYKKLNHIDEFEYYLRILDDLSFREIQILRLLYDFEQSNKVELKSHIVQRMKINSEFWNNFIDKAGVALKISKDEVEDLLIMTERSGCYISSRPHANDYRKQCGVTTHTFHKLIEIILDISK